MSALKVLSTILLFADRGQSNDAFIMGHTKMTWTEAEKWCLDTHGRHLASIHSDAELDAAASTVNAPSTDELPRPYNNGNNGPRYVWLGATGDEWTDGTEWGDYDGAALEHFSIQPNEVCLALNVPQFKTASSVEGQCDVTLLFPLCGNTARFIEVNEAKSWEDANAYCASEYGTTLATITNDDEAETVMNMMSGRKVWIGLNDKSNEGTWVWASGSECYGDCADLDWWNKNEPNNWRGEDCAHKRSDAKVATSTLLNDKGCEFKYRFICDGKDFVPKKRFVAVDSTKSWTEANAYCASEYGTTLATITNDDEAETVMNMFVGRKAWIGLNDRSKEGTWVWASGYECDGDCADLEWWNNNEPNNWRGEDCAHKRSDAKVATSTLLNDKGCEHKYRFICDGSASVSSKASIAVSGGAAVVAEDGSGSNEPAPVFGYGVFPEILAGAAVAIMAFVAIVFAVKRSRNKTKTDAAHDAAHHVAEVTPTDSVEAVSTEMPAEKQCVDEVHGDRTDAVEVVVAAEAPKESATMSSEKRMCFLC